MWEAFKRKLCCLDKVEHAKILEEWRAKQCDIYHWLKKEREKQNRQEIKCFYLKERNKSNIWIVVEEQKNMMLFCMTSVHKGMK